MLGESVAAWLLLPAVAAVAAIGLALLLERLTGQRMSLLRLPVGLCASICISLLVYELGGTAPVALAAVGLPAIAGLVLERANLRLRPGALAFTWFAAYGLHLAPVLLSGAWTWTGYNFVNDTSVQLLLADHLAAHGTAMIHVPQPTTASEHVRTYLDSEYPLGSHALLATLSRFVPAPLPALYQPTIAVLAASLAVGLAALARRMGLAAAAASAAGLVAVGANLYYQYALQGNIKEVAFLTALVAAAASGRELIASKRPLAGAPAVAVCFAAAFAVYSAAAAPYLLLLGAALAASALWGRERPSVRRLIEGGAAILVLSLLFALPTLLSAVRFNEVASGTFVSGAHSEDLGQLLRPLELIQAAGIWLTGDYRGPVPGARAGVTVAFCILVLGLVCLGAVWCLRSREPAGLALLATTAVSAAYLLPRLSPYADGKVLALASPVLVLMAAAGVLAVWLWWRPLAALLGGLVALGVIWSDAFAYHAVKLAPVGRLEALADVGSHFRRVRGLVMLNEPEQLAKNYTGGAALNVSSEAITPRQIQLRAPQGFSARYFDLDEQKPSYVESFPVLVKRRSPDASRPPVNYRLGYSNRWYEAWVRHPGTRVLEHLPLQALQHAALRPRCSDVLRLAGRTRRGQYLVAAHHPGDLRLMPRRGPRISGGWLKHPYISGTVFAGTPGIAATRVRVRGPGQYDAWVAGSFGRPVTARIDGRPIGQAGAVNNVGQWLPIGRVRVARGTHRLELERPSGSLRPGDGYEGELGPLVLVRAVPEQVHRVPAASARKLCGHAWDWIERVEKIPRRG